MTIIVTSCGCHVRNGAFLAGFIDKTVLIKCNKTPAGVNGAENYNTALKVTIAELVDSLWDALLNQLVDIDDKKFVIVVDTVDSK